MNRLHDFLRRAPFVSDAASLFYLRLLADSEDEGLPVVARTLSELSALSHCSRRTVYRLLDELRGAGLLYQLPNLDGHICLQLPMLRDVLAPETVTGPPVTPDATLVHGLVPRLVDTSDSPFVPHHHHPDDRRTAPLDSDEGRAFLADELASTDTPEAVERAIEDFIDKLPQSERQKQVYGFRVPIMCTLVRLRSGQS